MSFLELAKRRTTARKYLDKKVEKEKLQKILEAGNAAPTVVNTQPPKTIIIQKKEEFAKLAKGANTYNAPLAILVCSEQNDAWRRPFDGKYMGDIDASIVADHMMLQSAEQGLGTCWICHFNAEVIKKEFDLANNFEPSIILVIGYAADEPEVLNSLENYITDAVF